MELNDLDADQALLSLSGATLLLFTAEGCASCRWARQRLPAMMLPVDRIAWVDAGRNGGLVQRYGVYHLPALFVIREGLFYGALNVALTQQALSDAIVRCLGKVPEELP
ncbi:hypothetical protein IQ22_02680 [Pseudomonas duriflava]|uniref:Thioredoxin n=1 Tax=Pseudomonas duriflava TaxID=459528 RepID=A0A562Q9S6_9PSED|nr:thioredoxin family protein [Pseudomonas duriflava]TWI53463.1 hypothetical protein IQ22_02680 [Pseudomonas duriflava]